jgi:phosphocarrier protein
VNPPQTVRYDAAANRAPETAPCRQWRTGVIIEAMPALSEEMVINNRLGMHLRPAQQLVQTVLKFRCEVHIHKDGQRVNAKSIMGLLTLAAGKGTHIIVECDGDDAEHALAAVRVLLESGFGEDH